MSRKFYKLVGKEAVECKARGELTAWLKEFDHKQAIVGMTEVAGLLVVTTFRCFVDTERSINAARELCPFHSRLFMGWADEFNADLPINFPPAVKGSDQPVPEYHMPTWDDAEYVHRTVVNRLNSLYVNSGLIAQDIIKSLMHKAKHSDQ